MLEKTAACNTSICRSCSSLAQKFMKIGTTTSRREGLSSLEESQRLINDNSTIGTKSFKL